MAYIKYLVEEGLSERISSDREFYKKNKDLVEKRLQDDNAMKFKLGTNLMLDVEDDLLETAEMLQSCGAVSIGVVKDMENRILVQSILKHEQADRYQDLDKIRVDITNRNLNRKDMLCNYFPQFNLKNIYKNYVVEALAAYIDYLKKTGKYSEYLENREAEQQKTSEGFEKYSTIPGVQRIIDLAKTDADTESSLYCAIEGMRGVGKQTLVKYIAKTLKQNGKIHSSDYITMTFEELAISLGYRHRDYGESTFDNEYMYYSGFETHKLYVLTDLKEFLVAAEGCTEGDGSKYSHLIKLLGRYQSDTYIIVIGEKRYIDKFLKLSPSINFNFGKNVIHKDNLSSEELFEAYTKKLSKNLQNQLSEDTQFKTVFEQYIQKNRRAMPLENQELAAYLANYTNLQKELKLPPYAYQSKTAQEMLDSVIGMNNVKNTMAQFKKYAMFMKMAKEQGVAVPNANMHMIFTGNPGTGKTMVARIVGQLLFELGIIEDNKVVEVEPRNLIGTYIGESAQKTAAYVNQAMGGVLFIDEAYAIGNSECGKEAIATLIKSMEDYKDKFVVIFAGYDKEMHEFLNINSGIASRIGYNFHFDDYNGKELVEIFDVKMKNAGFVYDDSVLSAVGEITDHFAGKKNFGNGRFVDKIIQKVLINHANNFNENDDPKAIVATDIPSIEKMISTDVIEHIDIEESLGKIIGLENVKTKVRQFAAYTEFQQAAKKQGAVIPAGNMHMIFTGNPGTGKTTIARVMVDLLYSLDVIKERKLVEVERKDLIAGYIGQTAIKTGEVIERAMNGVLFVDEAYSLASESENDFGSEAIATLIKAMEDHKDELIVIFAGYKDEMRTFLKINPGIESRIGYTFDFEDYTVDELLEMYMRKMNKDMKFDVLDDVQDKLRNICEYFSKKPNYGNGRFVGRLVQETLVRHSNRVKEAGAELMEISSEDIPDITDLNNTSKTVSATDELSKIIGMGGVKEKLHEFEDMINFSIQAREFGITIPNLNFHMLFTGNPGTGKTTIARIITQKLFDIGVIMENKLIEVERKDLVAGFIGQTAPKTAEAIEKAMGGVLFIDEAYTLTPTSENDFGGEAIATLIKAMEDHKDDLIVIFAGYKKEMSEFVDSNPGIASRIGFTFHFDDYTADQLVEIYSRKMQGCGFTVEASAIPELQNVMDAFCCTPNFGNGRFVDKVIQNTILKHAKRHLTTKLDVIDAMDVPTIGELKKTMDNTPEERRMGF
ncbi:MAG: AAA family ATPase [Clostridiales bacterium]|nr:AAA family ATPase [Clostridiales bacterium]